VHASCTECAQSAEEGERKQAIANVWVVGKKSHMFERGYSDMSVNCAESAGQRAVACGSVLSQVRKHPCHDATAGYAPEVASRV